MINEFLTKVDDESCICVVTHYKPFIPGLGKEEDTPSEFEFMILNKDKTANFRLYELAVEDDDVFNRLQDEWEATVLEHKHMID